MHEELLPDGSDVYPDARDPAAVGTICTEKTNIRIIREFAK